MGITVYEWEAHFKQLSPEDRDKVIKALETLQKDETIFKEFGWTGLFVLLGIVKGVGA